MWDPDRDAPATLDQSTYIVASALVGGGGDNDDDKVLFWGSKWYQGHQVLQWFRKEENI